MITSCPVESDTVILAHLQLFVCKFSHKNGDGEKRKEGSERGMSSWDIWME